MNVCVFAASSSRIDKVYSEAASELGTLLAEAGMNILYGGGGIGLMGDLANAALQKGGSVTGVIPSFMVAEGWAHKLISDMVVTVDMGERKKWLFDRADAVVALPGGIGTLEELTEAITLKQLGIYRGPVVLLNTSGFYNTFIDFMEQLVEGNFLRLEHKDIWEIVHTPQEALNALTNYKGWLKDPRKIARII
jgi:uncharacterized protein (TIGR00730 family)